MSLTKQVNFIEHVSPALAEQLHQPKVADDSLKFTRLETPVMDVLDEKRGSGPKKVRKQRTTKKRKPTELQKLRAEKRRLSQELRITRKGINEDSKRKASENYSPFGNRNRLAKSTSELQSKMVQLENQIGRKESAKKDRKKKKVGTKLKKTLIAAGRQHEHILELSDKMVKIQLNEADLRGEIANDISARSSLSPISSRSSSARPGNSEDWDRVPSATGSCADSEHEGGGEDEIRLVSGLGAYAPTLEEKIAKADKMAHNYAMTRELRNTIHEHMISRSYSHSYLSIIPPYKKKKEKPRKTKMFFNRNVYEDKITVLDFSKKLRTKPTA